MTAPEFDLIARPWLPEGVTADVRFEDGWHERMSFTRRRGTHGMSGWTKVYEIPSKVAWHRVGGFLFPKFEPFKVVDQIAWSDIRRHWRDIGLRAIMAPLDDDGTTVLVDTPPRDL